MSYRENKSCFFVCLFDGKKTCDFLTGKTSENSTREKYDRLSMKVQLEDENFIN